MAEIIKGRTIVDDDWTVLRLTEGQTAADIHIPDGRTIVPFATWQARRAELLPRAIDGTLGVWLSDTEGPELIAGDVGAFRLIALDFPKFSNGRCYSSAALLRTRYGYRGELRAIGDVLRDQMFYLARVGFDSFAVRPGRSLQDALDALNDFSVQYQGAADDPRPLFRRVQRIAG